MALVLYLLMYRGLSILLLVLLAYCLPDRLILMWRQTAAELGLAIIALAPALLMARIEGRPFGSYGLPRASLWANCSGWARCGEWPRSACCCWCCAGPMRFILDARAARVRASEVRRVLGASSS